MRIFFAIALLSRVLMAQTESFTIREEFGVAHPKQIIDFDLHTKPDPSKSYLVGPDGAEAPFQLLRGERIAVETDLPAHGEKTWKLYEGHSPISAKGVQIRSTADGYELTNGITGVRIPGVNAALAPVQGVLYRDGVWTGVGPNLLTPAARALAVRFLERGPLKTIAELSYTFARPQDYYRCTIEVQADQPSILVEEDSNIDLHYRFLVSAGLNPNQARYRGHDATSVANGHFADGLVYNEPRDRDAIRDLPLDSVHRMAVWDPWISNSGWFWQLYNAAAGPSANVFGIFAGRASQAIGARHNGAGVFSDKGATGIDVQLSRHTPEGAVFDRMRLGWSIFVGTKADLSTIGRQMNLHSGINLNKIYRYPVNADLKVAAKPLYMSPSAAAKLALELRTNQLFFRHLWDADSTARPLLSYWHEPTAQRREELVAIPGQLAHDLVDALVNRSGIYDFLLHYWMGGLEMSRAANWIAAILGAEDATPQDKQTVRAAAVLFGEVLWDNDFVPMFDTHGLNLGTANMPVQQRGYQDLYALLLADLPSMRERAQEVVKSAKFDLENTVSETGAHMGSTHYLGASMGPLMSTLQQLQTAGMWDAFRDEPRLAKFAEFYMNLLTPPEQRFGGERKFVAIGDAGAESSELYGQLATGFAKVNPDLSARLMWAWHMDGAVHSGFHGTTILKIDESLPSADPKLGDARFPGWYSVLRDGWQTRDETAVWFVNGDYYRDHAHEDAGNVAIYALGAPLVLDWGSLYDPPSPGAMMHNAPVPEAKLKTRWDGEPQRENLGFRWREAKEEAFASTTHSSYSRASFQLDGAKWQRKVYSIHPDPSHPVIVIRDKFSGAGADAPKIIGWNVMAAGAVDTPAGSMMPGSPAQKLGGGLNRFGFTGVPQAGRIAIDADVYVKGASQAAIEHWEHHGAEQREADEFRKANGGKKFEEAQHILRLRGSGEFLTVILPHRRNDARADAVTEATGTITVRIGDETISFDENSWKFAGPQGAETGRFAQ